MTVIGVLVICGAVLLFLRGSGTLDDVYGIGFLLVGLGFMAYSRDHGIGNLFGCIGTGIIVCGAIAAIFSIVQRSRANRYRGL